MLAATAGLFAVSSAWFLCHARRIAEAGRKSSTAEAGNSFCFGLSSAIGVSGETPAGCFVDAGDVGTAGGFDWACLGLVHLASFDYGDGLYGESGAESGAAEFFRKMGGEVAAGRASLDWTGPQDFERSSGIVTVGSRSGVIDLCSPHLKWMHRFRRER